MGESKETLSIKQVHDNDKYIVTRTIVEEMNGQELLKVYDDLTNAATEAQKNLTDVPKQAEERTKVFQNTFNMLTDRKNVFEVYALKLRSEERMKEENKEEPSKPE